MIGVIMIVIVMLLLLNSVTHLEFFTQARNAFYLMVVMLKSFYNYSGQQKYSFSKSLIVSSANADDGIVMLLLSMFPK